MQQNAAFENILHDLHELELIAFDVAANGAWKREGEFVQGTGTDVTETAIVSGAVTASHKANFLNVGLWEVSLG
jgi:hypothetical protein